MSHCERTNPPSWQDVTSDGWRVADRKKFRLAIDYPPPRPWGYLNHILEDALHWPSAYVMWSIGFGCIAVAILTPLRFLMVPGIIALVGYLRVARPSVLGMRLSEVRTGVVRTLQPHPTLSYAATGTAERRDGQRRCVYFVNKAIVEGIIAGGDAAEVMFMEAAGQQWSMVIAVRPAADKAGSDSPEPSADTR